jgi:CheY-like chemotaxis protein
MSVLLVEDDPLQRNAMRRLIESGGQKVEIATTIAEALDKLACCHRILLDLNLSDGVGTTVLERVRTDHLPVKVAVLTGTSDAKLLNRVRELDPDAIFTKPPDLGELQSWLHS